MGSGNAELSCAGDGAPGAEREQAVAQLRALLGARKERSLSALRKLLWLAASVAAFVLVMRPLRLGDPTTTLLAVVAVLLFHELGHYAAMKLLGYRDLSIFFIPWLGAAAAGKEVKPSQVKRAVVSLSGPVPGILLGYVVLLALDWQAHAVLVFGVLLLFFLNTFNLIPLTPLDGGRLIEATVASRSTVVAVGLAVLSPAALIVLGAWWGDAVFVALGAVFLVGVPAKIGLIQLAGKLRREGLAFESGDIQALSDGELWAILSAVRARFPALSERAVAALVRTLHGRMIVSGMRVPAALGLLGVYVAAVAGGVVGIVLPIVMLRHGELRLHGKPVSRWVELLEGPDEGVRDQARRVLVAGITNSADPGLAAATAAGLEGLGEKSRPAVLILAQGLRHSDGTARIWSAKALSNLGPAAAPAVRELAAALRDPDEYVRTWAATAIAEMGQPADAAKRELLDALKDENGYVRVWAATGLSRLRPPDPLILGAIEKALDAESSQENRRTLEKIVSELKELLAATKAARQGPPGR